MSNKKVKILLTGGTGFLGKAVVPLLREKYDVHVISRTGKTEVTGDLCDWNAGLAINELKKEKYDIFLHMAGLYDLTADHVDCLQQNVAATGTVLKIANLLEIPIFMNMSSVAAAINSPLRTVKPYDLNFSHAFPDAYSESKALGEKLLQNWQDTSLRLKINFRLGVLVGDSQSGKIERIDGPYHAPYALEKIRSLIEKLPMALPLPGSESGFLPLVPVDAAAQAVVKFCEWALQTSETGYKSFHITPKEGLAIKNFYKSALRKRYIRNKGVNLVSKMPHWLLQKISSLAVKLPKEEMNYLLKFPQYDSCATQEILGQSWCPEFESYENTFWSGYEKYLSNR